MADKMMRIAGRDLDGRARPLRTNNLGFLLTKGTGSKLIRQLNNFIIPANGSVRVIDTDDFEEVQKYLTLEFGFVAEQEFENHVGLAFYFQGTQSPVYLTADDFADREIRQRFFEKFDLIGNSVRVTIHNRTDTTQTILSAYLKGVI